jgi:hypothetical protein
MERCRAISLPTQAASGHLPSLAATAGRVEVVTSSPKSTVGFRQCSKPLRGLVRLVATF